MDRQQFAYLLIILVTFAVALVAAYKWHHSHGRTYQRQIRKEAAEHERRMAERAETPPE